MRLDQEETWERPEVDWSVMAQILHPQFLDPHRSSMTLSHDLETSISLHFLFGKTDRAVTYLRRFNFAKCLKQGLVHSKQAASVVSVPIIIMIVIVTTPNVSGTAVTPGPGSH